jgi:predicted glycoside hydrolase/deacetylase ChbG (UPF0249 family)
MPREIAFIADDFGMSPEINDAICHAHEAGVLTGATLMMAQRGTDDAVARARALPSLQIGWHLHLNDSLPATTDRWPWGASPARAGVSIGLFPAARALMRREVARQWELFQATGLPCRFLTSHHHLHAHPLVWRAMLEVVGPQAETWVRLGEPRWFSAPPPAGLRLGHAAGEYFQRKHRRLSPWRASDTLWGLDRIFHMKADEVRAALATLPSGGLHEFLFHPRTRSCPDTRCLLELKPLSFS